MVRAMFSFSSRSGTAEGARRRGEGKRPELPATTTEDNRVVPKEEEEEEDYSECLEAFRTALIDRNLLPPRHDDYHTLMRSVSIALAPPTVQIIFLERISRWNSLRWFVWISFKFSTELAGLIIEICCDGVIEQ